MDDDLRIILQAVTGSTASGLATPDSDIDTLGVYVAPTESILGISHVRETVVHSAPDCTTHEVGKFIGLASKCNPTILELLFLDDYLVQTAEGKMLVDNRQVFLSDNVVNTYGGYAMQQLDKLHKRSDGTFSSQTRNRTAKHARHCLRLLQQGYELRTTGTLTVRVSNPEDLFAAGELALSDILSLDRMVRAGFDRLDNAASVLPPDPDLAAINRMLVSIRLANLEQAAGRRPNPRHGFGLERSY